MRASSFEHTLENARKAAYYYLECGSLPETGRNFKCDPKTIRNRFEILCNGDSGLYEKVIDMMAKHNRRTCNGEKVRHKVIHLSRDSFKEIGKRITRRELVDWYAGTKFNQNITVNELIKLAEGYGIQIVR